MSAATLEKPAERMVSAPAKAFVYLARRSGLKLVIKAEKRRTDAEGNIIETIPGERIAFMDGRLEVPPSGPMRGEKGEVLDSGKVRAFLEGDLEKGILPHGLLGDRFDGFWRHDEPAPVPTQAERDRLAELGMDLDVSGLAAFIAQEEDGWRREELLTLARSSLERAKTKVAERDAEIEKAREAGAAEARKEAGKAGAKA